MAGCGGGNSSPSSSTAPGFPGFTISLAPGSITLAQDGSAQTVQVSVAAHGGFSDTVTVTMPGLPVGISISPSSLALAPGASGTFTLSASKSASIAEIAGVVEGVAGTRIVDTPLHLRVNGVGVPDRVRLIGGTLVHAFYDQTRQLLFVTNPGLNELDVLSATDLSVRARVAVPVPWGIDQMADGKTLVIGTKMQQLVTVDEDTLAVTLHPVPAIPHLIFGLVYPNLVALANGKILLIGQIQGQESSDIAEGGQYVIEWDFANGSFKQLQPASQNLTWETDRIGRSADHKWAIFSADQFYLYSSDSDTFTTASISSVDPPDGSFGVRGYAINADGTKIGVVSSNQATFLNRSLQVLGTTPIPYAFQTARTAVTFTSDGGRLLLQYSFPVAIEALDANSYTAIGYYPGGIAPDDNLERMLTADADGRAFVGMGSALLEVDTTAIPLHNPTDPFASLAVESCVLPSSANAPLNTSSQLTFGTPPAPGTSYYFGGQPASLLSGGSSIEVPPSSVAGPVNVECVEPDGSTFVNTMGYAYGLDPIGVSATLLPPTGNPFVYVFGFGLAAPLSVRVGGQEPPSIPDVAEFGFRSLQVAAVQVPNGATNESADIAITSMNGNGSLANALTYIPSATVLPAASLLQVLYDPHRSLVYALKATEVDVLDPATRQWKSPFPLPSQGGSVSYNVMALSPDGSHLVAASASGVAAVLDPDHPSQVSPVGLMLGGASNLQIGSLAISKYNKALISGFPANEIDLATLNVRQINTRMGDLIRASADGSSLYGVDLNVSSGQVYSIDPLTYSVRSPKPFAFIFWTDLAVSPDGSSFAAIDGLPSAAGDVVGFYNSSLNLLNTNVYPFVSPPDDAQVLGSQFSPAGKVLVVPLGDSIEFWDTTTGALRGRLMVPEELHSLVYPEGPVPPQIALDATGQTIFAISTSGLTAMSLPEPIDDMPPHAWATAWQPSRRGSASSLGIAARMAAMRKSESKLTKIKH